MHSIISFTDNSGVFILPIRVLVKYLDSRVNLDAVRNRDVRVYISVRLSFMTYFDRSVWRRERTFNPGQITEMRGYTDLGTTRFEYFDTEDMVAEPCCRTGCPAVAQTMAETKVAVCTEIAVYILLSLRDEFVNAGRIRNPVKVEILPKKSSRPGPA